MLLGKRQRPPVKRITSMSEIRLDLNLPGESGPSDHQNPPSLTDPHQNPFGQNAQLIISVDQHHGILDQRLLAMVSPSGLQRRHSADYNSDTAHFLRSCSLCKRRLVAGHDIYMYRGDRAFCSAECREQQIKQDEKRDKIAFAAKKAPPVVAAAAVAGSGIEERVAAAV